VPIYPVKIVSGGGTSPIIAHVPHSSSHITEGARPQFLLSDEELRREVIRLTDWHTDRLFSWVTKLGGSMFINTVPRVIFDPERFVDDDDEPMAAVGQGVVYTKSTQGELLREIDDAQRAGFISELYEPYHEALTTMVSSSLDKFGTCLIIDCHSFATEPLPSEPNQETPRPDICIGTDSFHTPPALAEALEQAFTAEGFVTKRDSPFSGTIVPLRFYGRDSRVESVMIEVRRGLYCDEATGEPNTDFDRVQSIVENAVGNAVLAAVPGGLCNERSVDPPGPVSPGNVRGSRPSVAHEFVILDVFSLARHGQILLVWQAFPLDPTPEYSASGVQIGPMRVEVWTGDQPDWENPASPLTMMAAGADPVFDGTRGYPDDSGNQSLEVLRDAVVGRSIILATSGSNILSVEPGGEGTASSDEIAAKKQQPQLITRSYRFPRW